MAKKTPAATAALTWSTRARVSLRILGVFVEREREIEREGGSGEAYGVVDGLVLAAAERHVGDGALGAAARLGVRGDVVDAGDDAGEGAAAGVVEHLYGVELGLLRDTVGDAADCAGDVGPVAVTVVVVSVPGEVLKPLGTCLVVS